MAAFEYRALDGRGKEQKGILEADTAKQIRQALREKKNLRRLKLSLQQKGKNKLVAQKRRY